MAVPSRRRPEPCGSARCSEAAAVPALRVRRCHPPMPIPDATPPQVRRATSVGLRFPTDSVVPFQHQTWPTVGPHDTASLTEGLTEQHSAGQPREPCLPLNNPARSAASNSTPSSNTKWRSESNPRPTAANRCASFFTALAAASKPVITAGSKGSSAVTSVARVFA